MDGTDTTIVNNQNSDQPATSTSAPTTAEATSAHGHVEVNNSTEASKTSTDGPGKNDTSNEVNENDAKPSDKTADDKPKQEEEPPKPTASTTLISCANCNATIEEIKVQRGRDVEVDHLLNEALKASFTMEVCDDDEHKDKITATVEITVFEAIVELFALRNKSSHLIPLLEKTMKKNSIENANALGLGSQEPGTELKLLSLCTDCTNQIANLYESYKEFTLLSMKSNSFFSRILGSSASGAFAKSNIKTVPVPKSVQPQQKRNNDTPVIPEVIIEEDNMDYSANQTYSDNDEDMPYSMEVEAVYGESPLKITNSRGRVVTDHTNKGSGMFSEAAGSGRSGSASISAPRRGDTKRTCKKCGKAYYYTASYEKHKQMCTGPEICIGSVTGSSSLINSDQEAEEISILPDIHIDSSYTNSESGSYSSQHQYKCKYCSKECYTSSGLQKHERSHGYNTGSSSSTSSTVCKPCGRSFGSVYDLRRHYQTNAHKQRIREREAEPKSSWNYSY